MKTRFACCILTVVTLAACREARPQTRPATAVKVAPVGTQTAAPQLRFSARIEPVLRVDLAFKIGGRVAAIAAVKEAGGQTRWLQEGDEVAAGSVLARLATTDYLQGARQAEAVFGQAEASAQLAAAEAARVTRLAGSGAAAEANLEAATLRARAAEAERRAAYVQVERTRTTLADSRLTAPISGVVLARRVEVGTLVAPGTFAISLAQTAKVKALVAVPDHMLARMSVGSEQSIAVEAFSEVVFQGHVTRIAPAADPQSRTFEVEITLPNDDRRLKPGMVASLGVRADDARADTTPTVVPLSAIVRSPRSAGYAVYVLQDQSARPRVSALDVTLGDYGGATIGVTSGLRGHERVVVQGAGLLSDGETVEVIQ
jgi:membrane fusion protein, multidrug efflux system